MGIATLYLFRDVMSGDGYTLVVTICVNNQRQIGFTILFRFINSFKKCGYFYRFRNVQVTTFLVNRSMIQLR